MKGQQSSGGEKSRLLLARIKTWPEKGLRSRSRIWPFSKGLFETFIILFLTKIVLLYTCISKGMLLKMVLSGGSCSPPAGGSCCPARPPSRGRGRRPRSGTRLGPSAGPAPTSRVGTDDRRGFFLLLWFISSNPTWAPREGGLPRPKRPPSPLLDRCAKIFVTALPSLFCTTKI